MTTVIAINESIHGRSLMTGCNGTIDSIDILKIHAPNHTIVYCPNLLHEFGLMGICSFGLTLLNIVLILISGAIVLKVRKYNISLAEFVFVPFITVHMKPTLPIPKLYLVKVASNSNRSKKLHHTLQGRI
jgi:hypothetical protein